MISCSAPRRWFAILFVLALVSIAREGEATCQTRTSSAARRTATIAQRRAATAPDTRLAEGIAAFERGDDAAARDLLEQALVALPRNPEPRTYLGILADRAGDLAAAEQHFAAAARLAPRSASARNNYGAILLRLNRTPEAAAEFEASLRLDANQANALVNLAQIHFASNTSDGLGSAFDLFRRADALAADADIARSLTVIALRRADMNQAAAYYRVYAERLSAVHGGNATNAVARAELGGALLEANLLAEAEAELKAALKLDESNAEIIVHLARVHLARKDLKAAGLILETAVARKIETAPIYALLAEVYEKSGHPENAIPAMRLALVLDPDSEQNWFRYGIVLTNADAPAAAVIRLTEALEKFPKSPRIWLALGIANFNFNKNDEAARAFNQAIKLDAKLPQAFAYLGMMSDQTGQYDEAVKFFEQALQRDSKLAIVHYMIADTLLKKTDADTARIESHLKQAIQMDGNYPASRLALGKLYARTERLTQAAAELERVAALDPELAQTYYHLGRTYGRLNRAQEAKTALAKFKDLSDRQKLQGQTEQRDIVRRLADVRF